MVSQNLPQSGLSLFRPVHDKVIAMPDRLLLTKQTNKTVRLPLMLAFSFALSGFGSLAVAAESMHASIEKYEGSKTCLECHETLGKEVSESIHYKGRGPAPNLVGDEPGKQYGFLSGSCIPGITNAGNNWLALVQSQDAGKEGFAAGCALCHAGSGVKPAEKIEAGEYNNIDCLICHGPDYKRTVVKDSAKGNPDGYKIVPAPGVDSLKSARRRRKRRWRCACAVTPWLAAAPTSSVALSPR